MKSEKNKYALLIVYKLNFVIYHGLWNHDNNYIGYFYQEKKKGFWLL
jgi:hypothetical protein